MDQITALARTIDHTLLAAATTRSEVRKLCSEALEAGFATVCVNPCWVAVAAEMLAGSPVRVATVVGFPLGATTTAAKVAEAREALAAGARELDMVLALGMLRGGEDEAVASDVAAVAAAARGAGAVLKVILETAVLDRGEKERAASLAVAGGAHFLKTSTGFGGGGATVEDVALLRRCAPAGVEVKASGGIRTFPQARVMLAAGASRLGTSAGVTILAQAREYYAGRGDVGE